MAADFEQHDVVQLVFFFVTCMPEIDQLAGIIGIGEKTAATRRRGIVFKTKFFRQRHLGFAVTTGEIE